MSQQMPSSVQLTLSLEQLKTLIQEAVQDAVRDALQEIMDEDLNPTFAPEIAERLRRYRTAKLTGIPVNEVITELGLDD